jgi:acetyl esterase/lipase
MAGLFSLAACSPARLASALTPRGGVSVERGLAYGPLARQRLDLYTPAALAPEAPALLFIHGGAWTSGSRAEYGFVALPLAQSGALVAVADYRLWPEAAYPAFVEDTALATRWLAAREPRRRLVLMGHSAGAFNAAAAALDPRWGARPHVHGFIGIAGPYDFTPEEVTPPAIFAGLSRVEAVPPDARLADAPPLLLLHGARDTTVGPYHSERLAARARQAGTSLRHRVWPHLSHIDIMAGFTPAARWLRLGDPSVAEEATRFLAALRG